MALYVNIMALSAEGYDETGMRFQTELSITFDLNNSPESIKLDLSKRDEKSYFIALNGESLPFYIKAKNRFGQKMDEPDSGSQIKGSDTTKP